ncbi:hypothetical protein OW763_13790 [Clostridium aestuarii]|uniref:Lipoprotein n=1 Tax=Clostridium aestuarii TaxID=338193 RepID=A0ABT4D2C5_9CLOT|nr:hypothetical protein [Clostridium aestuarii]MCY6485403.1 hypothetical protein [Clostridium aestuarii]
MKNYKIDKSKILKLFIVIIVLSLLHGCSRETRGFGTPGIAGFTYEQAQNGKKIKKDIISDSQIKEFDCGILSGTYGSFFIEDDSVSFTILKVNLKDKKVNLRDGKNHSYKGTAKYKNKKYSLNIIIRWNGFGATVFGTLYDKSNKNEIKFEIS